jgi:5-formyltetrahydrofolate cyclo-ligase
MKKITTHLNIRQSLLQIFRQYDIIFIQKNMIDARSCPMEDLKDKKQDLRKKIEKKLTSLTRENLHKKLKRLENQLFEFANFLEAEVTLFYINRPNEVETRQILKRCKQESKGIVLPLFNSSANGVQLLKIFDINADLKAGPGNVLEPDPERCKSIHIGEIDLAIIPGIAFDEKGARLGDGSGRYDRFIPRLPATARKVAVALEEQITSSVPMESHDKYVDIIITDKRIIYKI